MQNADRVHFVLTSKELYYPYYLSIISALKTQRARKFILWSFHEPESRYWPLLKDKVELRSVEQRNFPALKGKPAHFFYAHHKDRIQYQVLYEHGGLFLDLDTFCVQDTMGLLDDSCEVVAPVATPSREGFDYPFNMCVLLARQGSVVMREALYSAEWVLNQDDMLWGDTGPKAFSLSANAHPDKVKAVAKGTLGGYGEMAWGVKNIYGPGTCLPVHTRVVHLFGKGQSQEFQAITEDFIAADNSLYAKTVKQVLSSKEWDPFSETTTSRPGTFTSLPESRKNIPPIGSPGEQEPPGIVPYEGTVTRHKRFHLLCLPHVVANKTDSLACAFTQKVIKMGKMLKSLGHTVFVYGVEGSEVECDEFVPVSTPAILKQTYGGYDRTKETYRHDVNDLAYLTFNRNAIPEIKRRMEPNDFLLIPFSPQGYQGILDALDTSAVDQTDRIHLTVEMGIGYRYPSCRYKVFESSSGMHFNWGLLDYHNGNWYDVVIPNYFDPDDFRYCAEKSDYFVYLGRIIKRKGIACAIAAVEAVGAKLIIAGQDGGENVDMSSPNVEYIGFVGVEERKELLAKAKGLFLPTIYIEPFGGVIIEAAMSGTPVITSNWGAFPELVIHGKTGYRCNTLDHFAWAADNIGNIKSADCYLYAMSNFSLDRVKWMYEEYFNMLLDVKENVNGEGWSRLHPERIGLNWQYKY